MFGEDNFFAWRVFQALMIFGGVCWTAYELARATGRAWVGVLFLWTVALAQSSIFWSFKFASEGPAEAFTYFAVAVSLAAARSVRRRRTTLFAAGIVLMIATLNRANSIVAVPAFALVVILQDWGVRDLRYARIGKSLGAFALGVMLVWAPWLARGYRLYGHLVPLTTQGVYSFLWELGPVTITGDDGAPVTKDVFALQREAPTTFRNDYDASQYAKKFARGWLQDHWREYPGLVLLRFESSLTRRDIALSKVPRNPLFPNWLNRLLLDKSIWACAAGMIVLCLAGIVRPRVLGMIPVVVLGQWLFGVLFLGDPRMLEPSLPFILFAVIFAAGFVVEAGLRSARRADESKSPARAAF
jgi:hypothetical protein